MKIPQRINSIRKVKLPKIIEDDNAQILAKYHLDGLLDRNLVFETFRGKYSISAIHNAIRFLNYKLVSSQVFAVYALKQKKNLSIKQISTILKMEYNNTRKLLKLAYKYVEELYETAKYRNR